MDELGQLRKELDHIDKQLVDLFEERMEVSIKIGQYKKNNNLSILDALREQAVMEQNTSYLKNKKFEKHLEEFFQHLMNMSKSVQER